MTVNADDGTTPGRALHLVPAPGPRRPPGRGQGLVGPECPQRRELDQVHKRMRMCFRCGRVTGCLDTDDMPWCGGDLPAEPGAEPIVAPTLSLLPRRPDPTVPAGTSVAPAATPAPPTPVVAVSTPGGRMVRYNPTLRRHSWAKLEEHHKECSFCGVHVQNHTRNHRDWWQSWTWPDGRTSSNEGEPSPKLPRCPGPSTGPSTEETS